MLISLSDTDHLWLANYEVKTEVMFLYPVRARVRVCVFFLYLGEQLPNSLPRKGNYAADYAY